jgi:hypothetical protein
MTLQRNRATAAPQFPGELIAGAGGLIGFGSNGAVAVPDPPGTARASTPGPSDASTQLQPGNGVGAGAARAHSDVQNQSADAFVASADSAGQGERTESHLVQRLTADTATTTVTSTASNILVSGVVHIGSVTAAAGWSVGQPGQAQVTVSDCSVGPVPCTVDEEGVHLQAGPSPADLEAAQHSLDALGASGTRIYVGGTNVDPASSTATAAGLIVEKVVMDPTGDTETTQKVYGYAAASSTATLAAGSGSPSLEDAAPLPLAEVTPAADAGGGVSSAYPGLPAAVADGGSRGALATPSLPLARGDLRAIGLVSRLSSGSILWMALGVLLWLASVGVRWAFVDETAG